MQMAKRNLAEYLRNWRLTLARKLMVDDVPPQPVYIVGANDGADAVPSIVNAAGEMTEASATVIQTMTQSIRNTTSYASPPLFGVRNVELVGANARRILFNPVITDAAGDSVLTELVPALAGYQPCMRLDYIFALGTDAAWDWIMSVPTAIVGPATINGLVSNANEIGPDFGRGLFFQGNTDAEAISVTIANGGNVLTYYFAGVYWYET